MCWIEGFAHGTEHSVFGYPFGTDGVRTEDFHIYVPSKVVAQPSLDGLSGALWNGFGAATNPEMAATFWMAVATFCYTDLLDSSGTFFAVAKVAGLTDRNGNLPLARQNMAYLADSRIKVCLMTSVRTPSPHCSAPCWACRRWPPLLNPPLAWRTVPRPVWRRWSPAPASY